MTIPNLAVSTESLPGDRHNTPQSTTQRVGASAVLQYQQNPNLMAPAVAAAYLGIKESTLAVWRCTKRYPLPFVKVGRLVYYNKNSLDAFLASRTISD